MSDLHNLVSAVEADPRDSLALSALADCLEELGANPVQVRALAIDGPTVLVFSYPPTTDGNHRFQSRIQEVVSQIMEFLKVHTKQPVKALLLPDTVSIKQIKVRAEEKKDEPPG